MAAEHAHAEALRGEHRIAAAACAAELAAFEHTHMELLKERDRVAAAALAAARAEATAEITRCTQDRKRSLGRVWAAFLL